MKAVIHIIFAATVGIVSLCAEGAPKTYPDGKLGKMVKLGEEILLHTNTHPLTKDFVGNKLTCANCHLSGADGKPGSSMGMSTLIGTATIFPAYSGREKTVLTLQDRSNNCFMRSMNGKRLIVDSEASIAIASYITWLSTGLPIQMNDRYPIGPYNIEKFVQGGEKFALIQFDATHQNYLNGQSIYEKKCARCHGIDGAGKEEKPPLWGKDANGQWLSYNTGASMSELDKGAVWIQLNMPLGEGGTLSDQETADVTLYINAQERADFDLKKSLLPKEEMGHYNATVFEEHQSVRKNFDTLDLDIDVIRGDKKIK